MHLSHHCCKDQRSTQLRQRYNPTFVHQPIFLQQPGKAITTRCTPTYHSTVLDTDGYNVKTVHARKQPVEVRPNTALNKSVYSNFSHERRIQDLNPKIQVFYSSKDHWYDHTKEKMLDTIRNCNHKGCSRERQYLNLSSDPVFTDFNYGIEVPKIRAYKMEEMNPEKRPIQQIVAQAPVQQQNQKQAEPSKQEIQPKQVEKLAQTKEKSTKKDFHKNCVPQYELEASRRTTQQIRRPQTANKGKVVSSNPTFTVIRGNKIQNRL